ncbi:MAG TPA: ParB/RepB/Spo0J family partition protein [Bacteroidota bacterium]|nr:ParB/RepB/Spo0J family partition protein [Bacteroidota bacterium]
MSTQGKKSVLGRGLGALIPRGSPKEMSVKQEHAIPDTGENGVLASIDIAKIRPNPFQPRTDFDKDALEELTKSIVEKGVIQPITVRRVDGGYEMIAGERRLRAAQAARLKQIPSYIVIVESDEEMLELALIENIQREHLNPIELANGYQRLMQECHLNTEEVAKRVGKERSTVTNFIRLLKLPQKIQDGLRKEVIQMGHARALINLPNEKTQLRLYDKIVDGGFSVRKVEDLVKAFAKRTVKHVKKIQGESDSNTGNIEEKLRQYLGTKVALRPKEKGRGEIVIEYYSLEDLDRLIELFAAAEKNY